jgi:hypothetical protein
LERTEVDPIPLAMPPETPVSGLGRFGTAITPEGRVVRPHDGRPLGIDLDRDTLGDLRGLPV